MNISFNAISRYVSINLLIFTNWDIFIYACLFEKICFLLSIGKEINSILIFIAFLSLLSIVLLAIRNVVFIFRFAFFVTVAFLEEKNDLFEMISLCLSIE